MKKSLFASIAIGLLLGVAANAADITWVSFHDTDGPSGAAAGAGLTDASDIGYTNLLSANGHNVTRFLTHEPLTGAEIDSLNASDLVIISRAVNSGHYEPPGDWNTQVSAPVLAMSGYILRNSRLNLTDGGTMVDTAGPLTLHADNPSHPVFNGVTVGGDGSVEALGNVVTENGALQRGISINMANLAGGSLIATSTEAATAGGPVIAEWMAGATVNNGDVLAGPRMIFMSGSREADGVTSETAGFFDLTSAGETMFLNAVEYMAVPEPSSNVLAIVGAVLFGMVRRRR
ncbi:MAG: PEP-CTERM sorting domain-containing protein [Planctomycetales bacterium]|nr:PEP-CTERM sorting domain-containing protein [Planctomycetales bacterium]